MNKPLKLAILAALAAGIAATLVARERYRHAVRAERAAATATAVAGLPRLLDLGAGKCVACKAMMPVLDEIRVAFAGKMAVEFIDVWENEEAAEKLGVETIPTQIFFDASGKELFRHTGFISKEDILAKWKELGVDLDAAPK
ncbi:MAG: thioredoxin family protein [Lentisphaerae bacterium]|nr:thioredoxin family protein [Lentisphaerota bacterium]